jgi:hypothetical protein
VADLALDGVVTVERGRELGLKFGQAAF